MSDENEADNVSILGDLVAAAPPGLPRLLAFAGGALGLFLLREVNRRKLLELLELRRQQLAAAAALQSICFQYTPSPVVRCSTCHTGICECGGCRCPGPAYRCSALGNPPP